MINDCNTIPWIAFTVSSYVQLIAGYRKIWCFIDPSPRKLRCLSAATHATAESRETAASCLRPQCVCLSVVTDCETGAEGWASSSPDKECQWINRTRQLQWGQVEWCHGLHCRKCRVWFFVCLLFWSLTNTFKSTTSLRHHQIFCPSILILQYYQSSHSHYPLNVNSL